MSERLEPDCSDGEKGHQRSIAFSLKRLADIAEAWAQGKFNYGPRP